MDEHDSRPAGSGADRGRSTGSALVVAHPDDEILFFSSIINQVDTVIICYLGNPRAPQRKPSRLRVLDAYPLDYVQCLAIDTSAASRFVDWEDAVEAECGLRIPDRAGQLCYRDSYREILTSLREKLAGYRTVYTHNPWGEYGHADHVQVHRAVSALAGELDFSLLFSNYVSPKSLPLALPYLSKTIYREPVSHSTDTRLAHAVRELYVREDCWTVPDDYCWPEIEFFNSSAPVDSGGTYLFPVNLIPWRYRARPAAQRRRSLSGAFGKFRKLVQRRTPG